MKNILRSHTYAFILSLLCMSTVLAQEEQPQEKIAEQAQQEKTYSGYNLLEDTCLAYAIQFGSTIAHELGHAITARILQGDSIRVVVGRMPQASDLIHPPTGITIDGFIPHGFSCFSLPQDPYKMIGIAAAGPLAGFFASYALQKWVRKYRPNYYFANISAYFAAINHAMNLIPIRINATIQTDGAHIYDALKKLNLIK